MKWRRGAFADLRTIPAVMEHLHTEAEDMAARAGEGYETSIGVTGGRVRGRAQVVTATPEAMRDNAQNHTLMRVLAGKSGLVEYVSRSGKRSWVTQKQRDNYMRNRKA